MPAKPADFGSGKVLEDPPGSVIVDRSTCFGSGGLSAAVWQKNSDPRE